MSDQTEPAVEPKPRKGIDPKILERRYALQELAKAEDKHTRAEARAQKAREARTKAIQRADAAEKDADLARDSVLEAKDYASRVLGLSQNGEA